MSPTPQDADISIGLIGMGDMGKMYARRLLQGGWTRVYACDLPSKTDELKKEFADTPLQVLPTGHHVSRVCDFIMYSVEAAHIASVVAQFGPSTKVGAVVAGQTSVKAPEKQAFDDHIPDDCHIVSLHSLHGPTVSPEGQPLVVIQHRAPDEKVRLVERILACFRSKFVYMTYAQHDLVTANTQAATHAAFLSMGTAWHSSASYPWETNRYTGGIEHIKINIALRIYANKWHVYAGLALLNPSAKVLIEQYARSTTDLFKLMVEGKKAELRARVFAARDKVFLRPSAEGVPKRTPILLSDRILDQFSLGPRPDERADAPLKPPRNSHLSLLAMADTWAALSIDPFADLDVAATPLFRMWIGVAEYLFREEERLDEAVDAAIDDRAHRADDTEFVVAARGWSQCVELGAWDIYRERFERTAAFFAPRFPEATKVGTEMIKVISAQSAQLAATTLSPAAPSAAS